MAQPKCRGAEQGSSEKMAPSRMAWVDCKLALEMVLTALSAAVPGRRRPRAAPEPRLSEARAGSTASVGAVWPNEMDAPLLKRPLGP